MNYICTWLCVDDKKEESYFPQTGKMSSSNEHQEIYWRCILVFYLTSIRFNKQEKHLLFTNAKQVPVVDGRDVQALLNEMNVEVIFTDFNYKTPKGYFFSFQNQFYEFSILEYITKNRKNANDTYLILDSDCIFLKPVDTLFAAAAKQGFISFEDDVKPEYVINGLNCNDLKEITEELLGHKIDTIPTYHLGEFFLASYENIEKIYNDFIKLWPVLLERHAAGKKKFNEEAHTLSYLYFKNGLKAGKRDSFMKRIWTNPTFYRNVADTDTDLAIWHLPAEKTYGIRKLYDLMMTYPGTYGA
ncbi:MAG: hypothetical protein ABI151_15970, partial [Chitinophagaceae bacterium]